MLLKAQLNTAGCQGRKQRAFTDRRPSRNFSVRASADEGSSTSTSEPSPSAPQPSPAKPKFVREFQSLGSKVIEQDEAFEEPPAKDPFEGESFEAFGQFVERWFLPSLVVLGLVCGGYAASTYNSDADLLIQPATSPEDTIKVIPASALQAAQTAPPVSQ